MKVLTILSQILSVLSVPIPQEKPIDILLTGLAATGCCETCGYSYCPSLDTCVKPWETYCKEFDFPYNVLYQGSGIIIPDKSSKSKVLQTAD